MKYLITFILLLSCNSSKSLRNAHFGSGKAKTTKSSSSNSTKTSLNTVSPRTTSSFINSWLGVPYKWGGMSKNGIDCSGFTLKYYQSVYQMTLNRTAAKQFNQGIFVKRSQLKKGDLVFFKGTTGRPGITHVGVYLSDNQFVHASTSKGVTVSDLNHSYYKKHYAGAKRIIK